MFTGYKIQEFISQFDTEEKCKMYLYERKWQDGFRCKKCNHLGHCTTTKFAELKCNRCKHRHSVTAGTLFHHLKFSIVDAFLIVFLVSTDKKGVSSLELHRRLGLRAKTCYYFKRKVMKSMEQDGDKLSGKVDVDESSFGGRELGNRGRSKGKKKEFVLGVQLLKKKIVRVYAMKIKNASTKELRPFFEKYVHKNALIRTDKWRSYQKLKIAYPNLKQEKSKPQQNFKLLHREIMMLKAAIRGIYHKVSHLQDYYEFFFRKNISDKNLLFDTVINNMLRFKPIFIKNLNMG